MRRGDQVIPTKTKRLKPSSCRTSCRLSLVPTRVYTLVSGFLFPAPACTSPAFLSARHGWPVAASHSDSSLNLRHLVPGTWTPRTPTLRTPKPPTQAKLLPSKPTALMSPSTTPTLDYAPHHDDAPPPPARKSLARKIFTSLTFWIVLGTAVGIVLGEVAPKFSKQAAPMAQLFLRPIQFIVFPLVFSSLVVGIAGQTDMKQLGRLSIKSFIYFEIVTTIALVIGLIAVNIVKPGNSSVKSKGEYKPTSSSTGLSLANWINHLAPKTWGEMMGGSGSSELLQVLVASILTGVATAQLHDQAAKRLIVEFARAVMEMMFKFVDIVIWTAPIGVCFAVANAIGANGMSALSSLGALVATVYGTLIFFVVVVFVPILLLFKINPISFLSAMREPLIIAYTTATSEAALPKVFEALDEYGVATNISAFVVPFGYSFNLDGTTLYLSLSAVFCAQAAGVHKSVGEQIVMVLMLMVSSKGVAGVRSAAIIVLASTLEQFDVPSWPVALILGADWFMDMGRTFTNVLGNCIAAVIMAKLENEFRTPQWEHDRQMRLQLASEQEEAEKAMRPSKLSVHEA